MLIQGKKQGRRKLPVKLNIKTHLQTEPESGIAFQLYGGDWEHQGPEYHGHQETQYRKVAPRGGLATSRA